MKDAAESEDTNLTAKPVYKDWESIAAISPASPYPYYFEGLIYHIQGNESKAKEAYQNALINPLFSENSAAFYYLSELGIDELSSIRDELAVIESGLYAIFMPRPYGLERHPMNFNDEYLRAKAKDVLEKEPNEYTEALKYYTAALRVNPFEAKNIKHGSQGIFAALLVFLVSRKEIPLLSEYMVFISLFLLTYFGLWIAYFTIGANFTILMLMAVIPVIYFILSEIWLHNLPAVVFTAIYGITHVLITYIDYR